MGTALFHPNLRDGPGQCASAMPALHQPHQGHCDRGKGHDDDCCASGLQGFALIVDGLAAPLSLSFGGRRTPAKKGRATITPAARAGKHLSPSHTGCKLHTNTTQALTFRSGSRLVPACPVKIPRTAAHSLRLICVYLKMAPGNPRIPGSGFLRVKRLSALRWPA